MAGARARDLCGIAILIALLGAGCGSSGGSAANGGGGTAGSATQTTGGIIASGRENNPSLASEIRRYRRAVLVHARSRRAWERLADALYLQARGRQYEKQESVGVLSEACDAWRKAQGLRGARVNSTIVLRVGQSCSHRPRPLLVR
jgi:hypothetical protein